MSTVTFWFDCPRQGCPHTAMVFFDREADGSYTRTVLGEDEPGGPRCTGGHRLSAEEASVLQRDGEHSLRRYLIDTESPSRID